MIAYCRRCLAEINISSFELAFNQLLEARMRTPNLDDFKSACFEQILPLSQRALHSSVIHHHENVHCWSTKGGSRIRDYVLIN